MKNGEFQSNKEYEEFLISNAEPPQNLSEKILEVVRRDLNPPALLIFGKLFLIHLAMGSVSLFACPQFGLTPTGSMGIMGFLMPFGDKVCALGCGTFFILGTVTVAGLLLRPEELKVLKRTKIVQFLVLTVFSLGIFYVVGAKVALAWIVMWFIGSWITGSVGAEIMTTLLSSLSI